MEHKTVHVKMGIFMKLYNFQTDERSNKPSGTIQYEVTKKGSDEKIFEFAEEVGEKTGTDFTVEKLLPLKTLEPGQYTLKMKVTDKLRNQTITPSATFTVIEGLTSVASAFPNK